VLCVQNQKRNKTETNPVTADLQRTRNAAQCGQYVKQGQKEPFNGSPMKQKHLAPLYISTSIKVGETNPKKI
jgi:hypothetical protein